MGQGDGQEVDWLDRLVDVVREIHELALEIGGGAPGEHTASLYAACARPFQSAFGGSIYTTPQDRAAALFHGIICDHAFVDGNKRTGTVAAFFLLGSENAWPEPDDQSQLRLELLAQVALAAASGRVTVRQVADWIQRIFEGDDAE
jgi:death-on-curing protein